MSFFVKAVVEALRAVPKVNARIDGDEIVQNHFFDIGVAVSTDKGLIVPVIRDCELKSFAQIEQEIADYAARAREGKIQLADLQGGGFTISNGGIYGSMLSTPILNPPAERDPRHAHHPGAPRGRRRPGRDPAHDVSGPQL